MPLIVIETVDIDSCTNSSVINLDAAGLVFQEEFCNRLQYSKAETTLDNVLTVFLKKRIFKAVSTNQLNLKCRYLSELRFFERRRAFYDYVNQLK